MEIQRPGDWRIDIVHTTDKPMQIALRPAVAHDFDYCKRLYFAGMKKIIEELNLDRGNQESGFLEQWAVQQVRIITVRVSDVGWLQSTMQEDALFLAQLFVDGPFQGQGIGTEVMNRLIGEAERLHCAVRLAVVKTNPVLRLYQRLGFRVTHEDGRKFYMRRDSDSAMAG
jgi:GNAT superfamily N-acetyltransferase